MKRVKIYLAVTGVITAVFIGTGLWLFRDSYLRLWESVCDLGDSLKYYVGRLFGKTWGHSSINELSKVFSSTGILPENAGELAEKIKRYFALLSDGENFRAWGEAMLNRAGTAGRAVMVALPCLLIVIVLIRRLYRKGNTRHNRDTVFLKAFKRAVCWVVPVRKTVSGYFGFLRESRAVKAGWGILWAVQLNLVSIGVSATAYYLWFSVSYDFSTLYIQAQKLTADLQVFFGVFPKWGLIVSAWLLFNRWRKKIAVNRLRHFEARNCGFINELPIVSMACGSMGKKKTTLVTDMVLSQEVMFRQKALEILQNNDMKFPHFPWICFERELRACMEHHTVHNLSSVKTWVALKRKRFQKHRDENR